jgi:hypothetical protein
VPIEYVEHADPRPEPISIARCRELLGEEAESMSDQELALVRRHAETMACMVIEMYQKGCRNTEQKSCLENATCPSPRLDLLCRLWSAR